MSHMGIFRRKPGRNIPLLYVAAFVFVNASLPWVRQFADLTSLVITQNSIGKKGKWARRWVSSRQHPFTKQEANVFAASSCAGENRRASIGSRQGLFCRLRQASRENQCSLQL